MDLSGGHPQIFAYLRTLGDVQALVLLNFKETDVDFEVTGAGKLDEYQLVLQNYESGKPAVDDKVALRGFEARVYLQG